MKLSQLLNKSDILRANIDMGLEIKDIRYNSKDVKPGDVFVAMKGNHTNGHLFIEDALCNGAVCVVCEALPADNNIPFVVVRNSRIALAQMSKEYFGAPDEKLKMIGVTGTNGKTSTTYFLKDILEYKYGKVVGLIGTNQNLVGNKPYSASNTTPQSYDTFKLLAQMVSCGCKFCVMEVSSHALEQHRVYGIRYEIGIFTNLSQDHLDFHENMENYKAAKKKLFKMSNYCVINFDDGNFNDLIDDSNVKSLSYSAEDDKCDLVAKNIVTKGYKVEFEALIKGEIYRMSIPVPGLFTVYNALAAIGAAIILGIGLSDISMALKNVKSVLGRYERVECGKPYDVIIDFAHTPQSMESVLSMTRKIAQGRIITVFGCGGDRDKTKRPIMGEIACRYSDICVITSDNSRSENPIEIICDILGGVKNSTNEVCMIKDRKSAILYAMSLAKEHDTILLLGKGHELYMESKGERISFDERAIVKSK